MERGKKFMAVECQRFIKDYFVFVGNLDCLSEVLSADSRALRQMEHSCVILGQQRGPTPSGGVQAIHEWILRSIIQLQS
jgi:hypothetical protein